MGKFISNLHRKATTATEPAVHAPGDYKISGWNSSTNEFIIIRYAKTQGRINYYEYFLFAGQLYYNIKCKNN